MSYRILYILADITCLDNYQQFAHGIPKFTPLFLFFSPKWLNSPDELVLRFCNLVFLRTYEPHREKW